MEKDNNLAWRLTMILCILLFGVFLFFFLLQNRRHTPQLVIENQDSDRENIANDWKNVFNDLNIAFNRITNN
jgi:preprotein translocase subunit SecG